MLIGKRVQLRPIREVDNAGRNHDALLYSLLRTDPRPWRRNDTDHVAEPGPG